PYASAVDANFVARLMGRVPAHASQQAGAGCQLVMALRIQADEPAAIVEVDGSFRSHRVGTWHLADAVEQQSLPVTEAVCAGAPDEQIHAGRQVEAAGRLRGEIAVDEQFLEIERLLERLEVGAGRGRPWLWSISGIDEAAHAVGLCLRVRGGVAPPAERQRH